MSTRIAMDKSTALALRAERPWLSGMTIEGWGRFSAALAFYQDYSFKYLDVPWEIEDVFALATMPEGGHQVRLVSDDPVYTQESRQLVASSEQSLLKYLHSGLSTGFWMALTPCFRTEQTIGELRRRYFMKLELCIAEEPDGWYDLEEALVDQMSHCALIFFLSQGAKNARIVATPEADGERGRRLITRFSRDIVVSKDGVDIELGSYGWRSWTHPFGKQITWVYGTGLAEPRFSAALAEGPPDPFVVDLDDPRNSLESLWTLP